jgi:hypothetical protein
MTNNVKLWLAGAMLPVAVAVNPVVAANFAPPAVPSPGERVATSGIVDRLIFFFTGKQNRYLRGDVRGQRTRLAGTRNDSGCAPDFVALIPKQNLGVTTAAKPTFWVYLAPTTRESSLNFQVMDSQNRPLWRVAHKLSPSQKGRLLKVVYGGRDLAVDRRYSWELVNQCPSSNIKLSGAVKREKLDNLAEGLRSTTDGRERLRLYAEYGVWHELLDELITARKQRPADGNLQADFRSLLESEDVRYLQGDSPEINQELIDRIMNATIVGELRGIEY